ncbi:MAG: hypothetical protein LBP59_01800 [Planctomycetaceae bacterium]|jgi:hypothetical protein|nr:hypothetical protein [Planctomycetaceae bacterium]
MKNIIILMAITIVILASTSMVYAGTEENQPDIYESVGSLSSYDRLHDEAVGRYKKLKAETLKEIQTDRGLSAIADILQKHKVQKEKIITDTFNNFVTQRRNEYFTKTKLIKSSIGHVNARRQGNPFKGGERHSDYVHVTITADSNWQRDGDHKIVDISKYTGSGGSGSMTPKSLPNGYSIECTVRGPRAGAPNSAHCWWDFKLIVPYKPANDTAFKDAFDKDKLQFKTNLRERIDKESLY